MQLITEGKARIHTDLHKVPSKKMPVFYNPRMKTNRDLTVSLLAALPAEGIRVADPLAASGIRAVRLLLELPEGAIESMHLNDCSEAALELAKRNMEENHLAGGKVQYSKADANDFLSQSKGFDYIDVDPFGTPNPFLDMSVKRISRGGILAVTATDTAALCGTFPSACRRKYWAEPLRNEVMHETGLRILIRKIQLVGVQYDKALIPVLSYAKEHYFRIFFKCIKGKEHCDRVIAGHAYMLFCSACRRQEISKTNGGGCCPGMKASGPMWVGKLFDEDMVSRMQGDNPLISQLKEEAAADCPMLYDIPELVSRHKLGLAPKKDDVISALRVKGFKAAWSHMHKLRTDAKTEDVAEAIKGIRWT